MENFKKIDSKIDLIRTQEDILAYWKKNKIFEKSMAKGNKTAVFYDGPPFPTGKPHHGTLMMSLVKDLIARQKTMTGLSVPRTWGWDCHGLPLETMAESELGISGKADIEKFGIGKFNDKCKSIVTGATETWRPYVEKAARWCEYDNAYMTLKTDYMESVLWAFKTAYNKGLIYKDYRVTPYCWRCETGLSVSDTRESDSTREKQDPWVIVKFKSTLPDTYFLAWTTTPWTLISNTALAVNPEMDYGFYKVGNETFIASVGAQSRYEKIFGKVEPIKVVKGKELVGLTYEPVFDYYKKLFSVSPNRAWRVIVADHVDDTSGVGIVHMAPAFGEEDFIAAKKADIGLVNPVDAKGRFDKKISDFAGRQVQEANQDIIRHLKKEGKHVADGTLVHNYPHCWRCREPLIYRAIDAWYFAVTKIKKDLLKQADKITWVPETIKEGRFGNWLENARDWNISRNRYFSTPIPVWQCDRCREMKVVGSIKELETEGRTWDGKKVKIKDLHREHLDKIEMDCPKCEGEMTRTPEVLDCWFEAGSMPYGSKHYPFENKELFEKTHPADFVVESALQIRCWFYYLHVLSVALFNKPAFKTVVVPGTLLAADGKKLSKSRKNYTDPMELLNTYGTDAYRLYLFQSSAMLLGDLQFKDEELAKGIQKILLPLVSSVSFFANYAVLDKITPKQVKTTPKATNSLDKWILALLYETEKQMTEAMKTYQIDMFLNPVEDLIDGLTNWYIRRSRRRFWKSENDGDKLEAYNTLYYVLVNILKLLAPAAPMTTEYLYKELTGGESVHLEDWPKIEKKFENKQILKETEVVQRVINLARSLRTKKQIKNRQPLRKIRVALGKTNMLVIKRNEDIILEELNIKDIEIVNKMEEIATIVYKPAFAYINQHYKNDVAEIIGLIKQNKFEVTRTGSIVLENGKEMDYGAVIVEAVAKDGKDVIGEAGIVVELDTTITKELKEEGEAREIVRAIQDARKTLDLEISDRIMLEFKGEYPTSFKAYIEQETLGTVGKVAKADITVPVELDTEIQVLIKKN